MGAAYIASDTIIYKRKLTEIQKEKGTKFKKENMDEIRKNSDRNEALNRIMSI